MKNRKVSRPEECAAEALQKSGVRAIPISVTRVARHYGIEVFVEEFAEDVSGVLLVEDEQPLIGVNSQHHMNRQRFSVAHELGHFLMHMSGRNTFVDGAFVFFRDHVSTQGTDLQEIEANAFAAALLMPEDAIYAELRRGEIDVLDEYAVDRMAAKFGVSAQALAIRLTKLRLVTM